MILQWRQSFPKKLNGIDTSNSRSSTHPSSSSSNNTDERSAVVVPTAVPFLFVQLAPWPEQDSGLIPAMRYGQEAAALALPKVGMVSRWSP